VEYLDAIAGVAVTSLGHAHPEIAAVMAEQAATLLHTSNVFRIDWQEQLGERLCALADMEKVFFCNSGAEANETALKLARLHGHRKQVAEPQILVMENAFHGRTLATLAATGNAAKQQGFEPQMPGFVRVPYDDIDAVRRAAQEVPGIVAVLVEPVQGEGGIRVASPGYLRALRELCDSQGWLLMLDEIQTGLGRTGAWFAHRHAGITPDVMTLAKALGNGVPIGACLARGAAADLFCPGPARLHLRWQSAGLPRGLHRARHHGKRRHGAAGSPAGRAPAGRAAAGSGRTPRCAGHPRPGADGWDRVEPELPGAGRPRAGRTAIADYRDP
jgi:acetylornithine aminotransferase